MFSYMNSRTAYTTTIGILIKCLNVTLHSLARKLEIIVKQTAMYGERPTVLLLASLCKPPSLPLQEHIGMRLIQKS